MPVTACIRCIPSFWTASCTTHCNNPVMRWPGHEWLSEGSPYQGKGATSAQNGPVQKPSKQGLLLPDMTWGKTCKKARRKVALADQEVKQEEALTLQNLALNLSHFNVNVLYWTVDLALQKGGLVMGFRFFGKKSDFWALLMKSLYINSPIIY